MMKAASALIFIALGLCACSKRPERAEAVVDASPPPAAAAIASHVDLNDSPEPSVPPKPARQIEVIRDKDEVERLAQAAHQADSSKRASADISTRSTPEGVDAVFYKGAQIFSAKHVVRTEAHPAGPVLILAQLVGDAAIVRADSVEYTEGQALDPVGIWLFANGQVRRITKPNGSAISAKFSPSGQRLAVSEYVQNPNHQNVAIRCYVVDVGTGKSAAVGGVFSGYSPVSIGEWLSESALRIFVTGESFLEQAITYEIPSI